MRIDKLLAHSGLGSRKEVKKILKDGLVEINGQLVTEPKFQVDPDQDQVTVSGIPLDYQEFVYFMLNKPQDVISATQDDYHHTVIDLLEPNDAIQDPHPVGRLDIDTEGLLILTNDGKLSHRLTSPNRGVEKTYYVEVEGSLSQDLVPLFEEGFKVDDELDAKPSKLEILSESEEGSRALLTLTEGKFHQVKRMMGAVGHPVTYLKRISMAGLALDEDLELGEYRPLTQAEVNLLKQA